tara:strand:- start:1496 stop:4438 length:2943 start_codon:yes stop_codon:yes gene_type:complete
VASTSAQAQIQIAIKNLGALTKLTKTLDKLNITTNKVLKKLEEMDEPSRQLKENLAKADKEANRLASGSLNKVTRELKEIEKTSQRASFSFGGLLSKLGALRGLSNKAFGKNFFGGLESGAALRGISDVLNKLNKTSFSNIARTLSDTAFSVTALGGALNVTKAALNFASPAAAVAGQFITLERSAAKFTENTINRFRSMNTKIIADSLQSFKQLGFLYDPRSALNMDIWKNFEDMKGGGFANMKGMQSRGKAALEGMFAPQIGRSWYGQTTFPNAFGNKQLSTVLPAMQMGGIGIESLTQYPNNLNLFPNNEKEYLTQLRENILLGKDINKENFRRKKVLEEVLKVENRIENQIRKNIALSKQSRKASGFKDWNAYINRGGNALLSPVEKSIRRHGRKVGHGFTADQYGPQPMFGPAMPPGMPQASMSWGKRFNKWGFGRNANPQGMFASRGGIGGRGRGAISSGMIGGAFPFLFGQGGTAALGGGLGGAVGGALGGGLGFGLSLIGTAVGQKIQEAKDFKKEIDKLNTSIKSTGGTSVFTVEKIKELAKSLGVTKEEALQMAGSFEQFGAAARTTLLEAFPDEKTFDYFASIKDNRSLLDGMLDMQKKIGFEQSKLALEVLKTQGFRAAEIFLLDKTLEKQKQVRIDAAKAKNSKIGGGELLGDLGSMLQQIDEANIDKEFADMKKEAEDLINKTKEWNKALKDALTEDQAKQAFEDLIKSQNKLNERTELEKELANAINEEARIEAKLKLAILDIEGKITDEQRKRLKDAIRAGEQTEKVKVTWEEIKDVVATGLTDAVMGLIEGTKSLGESLASIAKSIGRMFLNAAFQNLMPASLTGAVIKNAEGGYATNGIKPFSTGGLVTRPTIGLVGEAGEDEYIIPASKMQGAMERYSSGARGQAVIPGGGTVASGSGVSSSPTVVNYTGPVLSFNSESYVPKSAIPEIINSAARRGAQEGESKVFSKLKNSRSQRSRVGL